MKLFYVELTASCGATSSRPLASAPGADHRGVLCANQPGEHIWAGNQRSLEGFFGVGRSGEVRRPSAAAGRHCREHVAGATVHRPDSSSSVPRAAGGRGMMGFRFQDPLWLLLLPAGCGRVWSAGAAGARRPCSIRTSRLLSRCRQTLAQRIRQSAAVGLPGRTGAVERSRWPGRNWARKSSASAPRASPSRCASTAPARCRPWISRSTASRRIGWRWSKKVFRDFVNGGGGSARPAGRSDRAGRFRRLCRGEVPSDPRPRGARCNCSTG